MFKTNLKIAWRNLIKDRQFTFLNVFGLATGLACALLIFLWVNDEMSFDRSFANNDRLYQLMEHRKANGETATSDESSGLLSETLVHQVPEIECASPLAPAEWFPKYTLSVDDKNIKASGQYAGRDYFRIFSFRLLSGQSSNVLANKNSIVISDELARRLFGTIDDLIGKPVRFQQDTTFYVSGVFETPFYHSSQQFDFVLSFDYLGDVQPWVKTWNNTGPHNFVLLRKGADIKAFNRKISTAITANGGDTSRSAFAT